MLSFANNALSFYLLVLLGLTGLAASAPTTYHRHQNSPFPYGKLADKILNVNHVSYMIDDVNDDDDDDRLRTYPENHSMPFSSSALPTPTSFDLTLAAPNNTYVPNIGSKNLFSFAYRILVPDIVRKSLLGKWDAAALMLLRTMREFNNGLRTVSWFNIQRSIPFQVLPLFSFFFDN